MWYVGYFYDANVIKKVITKKLSVKKRLKKGIIWLEICFFAHFLLILRP